MGLSDLETIPESGAVFTVGRSRFADNIASHFFIRKDPVISITCGDEHSAVICQSGRLFVFGSNDWGQLGLGHRNHISKPSCVKVLKPEKVTHVACGRAHTLICTGAQKIFACGSDQEGQLGRGTSAIGDSSSSPVLVYDSGMVGPKILQLAAGSHHSLALISDGGVFAWGSNLEGQLGLPDVSGLVNKPTKVHIPEPVKQISAGYYHSAFLTESGLIYVCGESESGKLGIDVNFSTQITPKQMQLPCPAVTVTCGGHHTVVLAENGNLYCTGSNSNGQLGFGTSVTELHTPKLLPRGVLQNETISRVSCGESHTAIVTGSGNLFTCGDGRHGKLGLEENENNVHELTFVQRYKELFVSQVACGGCHTILVGQRRETDNHARRDKETEHIQKRTSLPPLKLPVNKLQTEAREEKPNDTVKAQINPEKSALPPTTETPLDNVKNTEENTTSNVTDSMNNVEKPESPKKPSNVASQEIDTAVSETKPEMEAKEAPASTEESQESKVSNENHQSKDETEKVEPKNENEKMEPKVDEENNVKEEVPETENDKSNKENNNEMTETDATKQEEVNEKDTVKDNKGNNEEDKKEPVNEQTESSDINKDQEKTSPEKQTSPTNVTPPPKPPRLKPGSGNSSTTEIMSSMKKESDNNIDKDEKKEDTEDKKTETNENDESKKQETSSKRSSAKSKSSKSTRSMIGTEDTIEIDKQDDKEKIVEEERMNNDNVQDDADVVESPAPRTAGRMSKIFKPKKPQAIENGTKAAGAVTHKPKSKACSIL